MADKKIASKGILKDLKEMKTLSKGITYGSDKKGGPKKFMKKGDMFWDQGYETAGPKRQKNRSQIKLVNTPTKFDFTNLNKPAYKKAGGKMSKYYADGGIVITGRD